MVKFRFYGQLNDFLPWQWRYGRFAHTLRGPVSVKDIIESLGVPHPEVDVIVVNGQPVDFTYRMQDGDDVAVYPAFHHVDVTGLRCVGSDPPQPLRFVLDIHLRKLAALLRLAGFDALLSTEDAEVAELSAAHGRVALTRDVGLLKRRIIEHGYWVRHTDPELQLIEVLERFDLADRMDPFVRCMECNTLVAPVDPEVVAERLPPGTREVFQPISSLSGMRPGLLARLTLRAVGSSTRTRPRIGTQSVRLKATFRGGRSASIARMRNRIALLTALSVVMALPSSLTGQRAPFASPPPGSGPTPMRPYGQSAGCSEDPVAFHRCALEKMKTFSPPRTPDGKPDFSGFWNRIVVRNMENIEEHPQTMDTSGGRSAIIDPADGKIPYQPWAAARRDEMFSAYVNPMSLCMTLGVPKQAYGPGVFRIVQTPSSIFMINDYAHSYRIIPTDGRPHVGRDIRLYAGDSRGTWEGNTLVIDVTNQKDKIWLDAVGNFFSENVDVVERFTMIDKDVLHYQATVTDPNVYTRPWTMVSGWKRNTDQPLEIWENACWEGIQENLGEVTYSRKQYPGAAALPK